MKDKYIYVFGVVAVGALVECYTFNYTKDINKSTGIGWGTFVAFLIMSSE